MFYEKINKIILSILSSSVVQVFSPTLDHLKALLIVMIIDLAVGLYHSFVYDGKKFDPKKMKSKGFEISMFIITLFATLNINVLWKQYGLDGVSVAHYLISTFGFYHFFSILQNMGKMGFPIANYFQKFIENKAPDLQNLKTEDKKEVSDEDKK